MFTCTLLVVKLVEYSFCVYVYLACSEVVEYLLVVKLVEYSFCVYVYLACSEVGGVLILCLRVPCL